MYIVYTFAKYLMQYIKILYNTFCITCKNIILMLFVVDFQNIYYIKLYNTA